MIETKELTFKIPSMNKDVTVKVTVHHNLMGILEITTQIGDEPPLVRITNVHNINVVK
jgi:subtilisin-like proprotein convertase family protein